MLRSTWWVRGGSKTVRARRIFLSPANRDQGGETACLPLFLGKQKSETCLSQLSHSLQNKKRVVSDLCVTDHMKLNNKLYFKDTFSLAMAFCNGKGSV